MASAGGRDDGPSLGPNDMSEHIDYFVDGKPFTTGKSELTVDEVLTQVGMSAAQFFLLSPDGTDYRGPDTVVEIHAGDRFETRKREDARPQTIHYKVNGEEQTTQQTSLTVEDILRHAGAAASIDIREVGDYFLENIATGRKYENLGARVDIEEGDQFLAVHCGATPVA